MPISDEVLEAYGERKLEEYSHWVYVLECKGRFFYDSYDELEDRADRRIDRKPNWLRMAWEADRLVYVGQTENLHKRLGQHFKDKLSSDFTTLFEPYDVIYLQPEKSRNRAEYQEEKIGKSYYDKEDVYAYWR